MVIIMRGKALRSFVKDSPSDVTSMSDEDIEKRDLAPAYTITSVRCSCKPAVRRMTCPREAWKTLHSTFVAISENTLDAMLTRL